MQIDQGWLDQVNQVISPNNDIRPDINDISLLVIHNISLPPEQFGGPYIAQLFSNCLDPNEHAYFQDIYQLKVSSHLLIDREGQITQFVPFDRRAWHAGESSFRGQDNCNDNSIGIELEGTDNSVFNHHQYDSLKKAIKLLTSTYSEISIDRIVGHSDVAPNRKTDPGQLFDWGILKGIA